MTSVSCRHSAFSLPQHSVGESAQVEPAAEEGGVVGDIALLLVAGIVDGAVYVGAGMDGEDKLVFIRQRIESLEMLVGALVHLGQFEVEVVPMDAFHTALPFFLCLLTALVVQEHYLHIIEQPDGHLLLSPCTEDIAVFRLIAGDET